jgi:sporulation protein YabP
MTDHSIISENRENLTVTAVTDVKSFDSENIHITLREGGLSVKGKNLKIIQLDLDEGKVSISGECSSLIYTDSGMETGTSILIRIMK